MEILELRPLLIFFIEMFLGYFVLRKGKFARIPIAFIIFLLAGYQAGEFIIIKYPELQLGYQAAFFYTTLLPPFGIYLIEKFTKRNFGSVFFFIVGIILAIGFIVLPNPTFLADTCLCFAKFAPVKGDGQNFLVLWGIYYIGGLTYALLLNLIMYLLEKVKKKKLILLNGLLAYIFFYPFSYILMVIFNWDIGYVISVMCSMALIAAIILFRISVKYSE